MGDWADEVEDSLLKENADGNYVYVGVAAALRKARADALDEAIERIGYLRWREVDPFDGRTLGEAVKTIMYMKDKT